MTGWTTELKYAVRTVLGQRAVSGLAILTLSLGIGAATTVFNVVETVLLEPLPYPDSDRLIRIYERHERADQLGTAPLTYASTRDLGTESATLSQIAAYREWLFNLTGDEAPERLNGALVTSGFFQTLGVRPALGRFFLAEEHEGSVAVVVLRHDLWVNRYGADPGIIGRTLRVNDADTQVVGVMPESFEYPRGANLWMPLSNRSGLWGNRTAHLLSALARVRPGTGLDQVRAELTATGSRIQEENPEADPEMVLFPRGMLEAQTSDVRSQLFLLLGAVLAVLLIGCVNVANLLTSQASTRAKQLSIRAALGASRSRLIRQSLWESLWIALMAGVGGLTISFWTTGLFRRHAPDVIPRIDQLGVNPGLVAMAFAIAATTVLLFGLLPAIRSARPNLTEALREGERMMPGGRGNRTRDLLVVAEVALAMILLVGAALLLTSFLKVMQVDLGIQPDRVLAFQIYLSPNRYSEGDSQGRQTLVLSEIIEEIRSLPEVQSAGLVNVAPLAGGPASGFHVEGQPHPPGESPLAEIRVVDPDYFSTLGIPLLEGRAFTSSDRGDSEPVMVVSQSLAGGFLRDGGALDRRLTMTGWGDPRAARVVGVVGDIKARTLEDPNRPTIYWPYTQFPQIFNTIVVKTRGNPMEVLPLVRERVWSVDSEQPLAAVSTMVDQIRNSTAERRFLMTLVGFFSVLALTLAMVGLYGVISYNITQRIPEIGLRMALGATRARVLLLVFSRGFFLTFVGVVLGSLGSLALSRQLTNLLFGTTPTDPFSYLAVSGLMLAVAFSACLMPALRALRVDPLVALKS